LENIGPQIFFFSGILFSTGLFFFINSLLYIPKYRDPTGLTIGLTLFFLSYIVIYAAIVKIGLINEIPWILGTDIVVSSITMILMSLTAAFNARSPLKWKWSYSFVFLLPLYMIAAWFINTSFDYNDQLLIVNKSVVDERITGFFDPITFSLYVGLHAFVSIFAMYQLIKSLRFEKVPLKKVPFVVAASGFFAAFVVFVMSFQVRNVFSVIFPWGLSSAEFAFFYSTVFIFYGCFQIFPYFFKHGAVFFDVKTFSIDRYRSPVLSGLNLEKVSRLVSSAMEEKKLHLNEGVTMPVIAREIGISSHEFSAYLNQHRDQNFSEFINFYRIQEAKTILKKSRDANILKLSYDVGYNNPSSFYRAFKKETGFSPKQWIKKL